MAYAKDVVFAMGKQKNPELDTNSSLYINKKLKRFLWNFNLLINNFKPVDVIFNDI